MQVALNLPYIQCVMYILVVTPFHSTIHCLSSVACNRWYSESRVYTIVLQIIVVGLSVPRWNLTKIGSFCVWVRSWIFNCACAQVLARVRRRRSPIIAPEAKQWQDRNNRQFACLRYFFMNVDEFVEQRKAVQEPPGVDKLLTLCIFPVESLRLTHVIASTSTHRYMIHDKERW